MRLIKKDELMHYKYIERKKNGDGSYSYVYPSDAKKSSPLSKIGSAASSAGKAIGGGAKAVGNAVGSGAKSVSNKVSAAKQKKAAKKTNKEIANNMAKAAPKIDQAIKKSAKDFGTVVTAYHKGNSTTKTNSADMSTKALKKDVKNYGKGIQKNLEKAKNTKNENFKTDQLRAAAYGAGAKQATNDILNSRKLSTKVYNALKKDKPSENKINVPNPKQVVNGATNALKKKSFETQRTEKEMAKAVAKAAPKIDQAIKDRSKNFKAGMQGYVRGRNSSINDSNKTIKEANKLSRKQVERLDDNIKRTKRSGDSSGVAAYTNSKTYTNAVIKGREDTLNERKLSTKTKKAASKAGSAIASGASKAANAIGTGAKKASVAVANSRAGKAAKDAGSVAVSGLKTAGTTAKKGAKAAASAVSSGASVAASKASGAAKAGKNFISGLLNKKKIV